MTLAAVLFALISHWWHRNKSWLCNELGKCRPIFSIWNWSAVEEIPFNQVHRVLCPTIEHESILELRKLCCHLLLKKINELNVTSLVARFYITMPCLLKDRNSVSFTEERGIFFIMLAGSNHKLLCHIHWESLGPGARVSWHHSQSFFASCNEKTSKNLVLFRQISVIYVTWSEVPVWDL